jgi:hypothetical protein
MISENVLAGAFWAATRCAAVAVGAAFVLLLHLLPFQLLGDGLHAHKTPHESSRTCVVNNGV